LCAFFRFGFDEKNVFWVRKKEGLLVLYLACFSFEAMSPWESCPWYVGDKKHLVFHVKYKTLLSGNESLLSDALVEHKNKLAKQARSQF
jgi:hypothetical protein